MQETSNRPKSTSHSPLSFVGSKGHTARRESFQVTHRLLIIGVIFFGLSFFAGAAAYLVRAYKEPSPTSTTLPLAAVVESVERGVVQPPAAQPAPPPPPPLVKVDSYAASDFHPLSDWTELPGTYGYVDTVTIGADSAVPLTSQALSNDDVLTLSGWAGHQLLGMTMVRVLFSVCDQIVGDTAVNMYRPDVAKAVHPYLEKSGWRGQLAVAHLPRCDGATLKAFGLAAKGANLWLLMQETALNLPPTDAEKAARFEPRVYSLDFKKRLTPKAQNITIRASALRVRRCGGSNCTVLGKVRRGVYKGYVVEHRDGWVLIQLPTLSGWLSEKHIQIDG